MAVVRLEALRALANTLAACLPQLEVGVCVGQRPYGSVQGWPNISVYPFRWTYTPHQALEVYEPAPDTVIMDVGHHTASVQVRIGAATAGERYELEQAFLDVFLGTPLKPGVLITRVTACENLGPFVAAWTLDDDDWDDERAFDSEYYSTITLTGVIPALVTRRGAYTIEQLQLGITPDLTQTDMDPPTQVVQVNEDGTISAVA